MNEIDSTKKAQSFRVSKCFQNKPRYFSQQKASSVASSSSQFSCEYMKITQKAGDKLGFKKRKLSQTLNNLNQHHSGMRLQSQSILNKNKLLPENLQTNFVSLTPNFLKSTSLNFGNRSFLKPKRKRDFRIIQVSNYSVLNEQEDLHEGNNLKNKHKNIDEVIRIKQGYSQQKQRLFYHVQKLFDIYQHLFGENRKINTKEISIYLKTYILQKSQGKIYTVEEIFVKKDDKKQFKQLLAYQKVLIISIINLIYHQKLGNLSNQCGLLLKNIIGLYYYLLRRFQQKNRQIFSKQYQKMKLKMQDYNISEKTSIASTILFIATKLHTLFRYSPQLYKKVKIIAEQSSKISVNRTFYNLLTTFAIYLNQGPISKINNNLMRSFATCPSPFIVQQRNQNKQYTLVIDLDETLIYSQFNNGNYKVKFRPYSINFIKNLSQFYEIIIFTSSISSYAQQIVQKLDGVSHILCREHTIKIKGQTIKDLSRIGRSLQSTIIIDNLPANFKLQQQNGIVIKSWYGDQNDKQLKVMQSVLIKLLTDKPKDVRQFLSQNLSK